MSKFNQNTNEIVLEGILNMSKGEFDLALDIFNQAKIINPLDSDIYACTGQLYCVKKLYDLALKNFLIFIHLNIIKNCKINTLSGEKYYSNILKDGNENYKLQKKFFDNINKFKNRNQNDKPLIRHNIVVSDSAINFYCLARPPLQMCVVHDHICLYSGYCYIIEDKVTQTWTSITEEELNDIISVIDPTKNNWSVKATTKENIFLFAGFLYLALNLHRIKDIDNIPSYYLNEEFKLNKELNKINDYLDKEPF